MIIEPHWMAIARKYIGVREIKGPKHNPTIMSWVRNLGARVLGITVTDDETAWCGSFAAQVVTEAGFTPPRIAVRARAWADFGVPISSPVVGAIVVFERPGGGHVGFVVGIDATHVHCLGGNQSDSVNIMRLERSRVIAYRWPAGVPVSTFVRRMNAAGVPVSTNEN